jgi:hypothetical protein
MTVQMGVHSQILLNKIVAGYNLPSPELIYMMINSEVSSFCTEILLGQLMELLMEKLDLRIADLEYYQPQQGTQNKICVHGFIKLQMASTHVLEWRVAILTLKHNLCIKKCIVAMLTLLHTISA